MVYIIEHTKESRHEKIFIRFYGKLQNLSADVVSAIGNPAVISSMYVDEMENNLKVGIADEALLMQISGYSYFSEGDSPVQFTYEEPLDTASDLMGGDGSFWVHARCMWAVWCQ